MARPEFTPPYSPIWSSSSFSLEHPDDNDTLALIGTSRLPHRDDIKSILITGGAGFIGGWVTRHLTVQYPEYNIVCFDKLDLVSSKANVSCLEHLPNFAFVQGDITSSGEVSHVLLSRNVDCVMHFAASSHVQKSFEAASSFTHNNVVGTQVLLDCVRQYGRVNRFLHVSTDEVYGESKGEFFEETNQLLPTNPYSASKAAAEMYVHAYAKSFKIPTIIVRSNNVYGPCQYPEKIIPRFFSLLSNKKPLTIQGSGLNSRRYLYSADAADAFDTILHKGAIGEAYNIGSAFETTNLDVAVRMMQLFGYSPKADFQSQLSYVEDRPFNDYDYCVDGSKLQCLGWRQQTPFETGLAATIGWYRRNIHAWWSSETSPKDVIEESSCVY